MESHDEVIFTFTPPGKVYAQFVSAVRQRWPKVLWSIEWNANRFAGLGTLKMLKHLSRGGWLLAVRDRQMERHFLRNAYKAWNDGEGAIGLAIRKRQELLFKLGEIDQLRVKDPGLGKVMPYTGWLCTPWVWEVTTMTPEDPAGDAFSKWVFDAAVAACTLGRLNRPVSGKRAGRDNLAVE